MNKDLIRFPEHLQRNNLFAWSSADELLVDYVLQIENIDKKMILIVNDQFGALSSNLVHLNIDVYVDSYISTKSIEINTKGQVKTLNTFREFKAKYDLVLVYLPKSNFFFEDILCHITNVVEKETQIIFTGMIKHISKGHFKLIEKYIGPLNTSLAVKKARLIFASFEKAIQNSPYPKEVRIPEFDQTFINHSNVFSCDSLDIGTRFFLENLPSSLTGHILDLGCANGIVGIRAKMQNKNANMYFTDESMMAIESAKMNYRHCCSEDEAHFLWTYNLDGLEGVLFDLILCNPPFHQGTAVGTHIAVDMFESSFVALKRGGVLRIIANSHLQYHIHLKRIFGNFKLINSNKKFVIYDCVKN